MVNWRCIAKRKSGVVLGDVPVSLQRSGEDHTASELMHDNVLSQFAPQLQGVDRRCACVSRAEARQGDGRPREELVHGYTNLSEGGTVWYLAHLVFDDNLAILWNIRVGGVAAHLRDHGWPRRW